MANLTSLFQDDNYKAFKTHKLYVYCDLYDKIEKFHKLDEAMYAAAKTQIVHPTKEEDINATQAKFKNAQSFDGNLMELHRDQVEIELNNGSYGALDKEIRFILKLQPNPNP